MQIKNSVLKGDKKYNIAGVAVASVAKNTFYGYYKTRMRHQVLRYLQHFGLKINQT
ncbi:hypothetical protein [Flavivirga aquatica]|uniref:hypothetical protein n=1 Tax=Flavivirga aquatica TaxID=1849968 RepID=UPI0013F4D13E|nr:hypothetical protein [Flavivirga aquatica]